LSLTINFDWSLHQFDMNNIFLYGDLEQKKSIWTYPPGHSYQPNKKLVCKLEQSLYSLTQSSRIWFEQFYKAMKSYRYTQSDYDHIVFFKHHCYTKHLFLFVDLQNNLEFYNLSCLSFV
jgi:Reverse transcriptase (RNA-dependent DNA polymerase)